MNKLGKTFASLLKERTYHVKRLTIVFLIYVYCFGQCLLLLHLTFHFLKIYIVRIKVHCRSVFKTFDLAYILAKVTHSNDIVISYTPCRDTAISSRGGISLSSTPYYACANVILPYRINNKLNKLHQTIIIFRIPDGTIPFNNARIQTHALGAICVRRDGI